jgi:hypothetical protein
MLTPDALELWANRRRQLMTADLDGWGAVDVLRPGVLPSRTRSTTSGCPVTTEA